MPDVTPYITHVDMREYLGQVQPSETTDAVMNKIGIRATDMVNTILEFAFEPYAEEPTTRTISAYGTQVLRLPPHERGSITEVKAGGVTLLTDWTEQDDGTLLWGAPGQYYPYAYGNAPMVGGWGYMVYTVTAKWGYGPVPEAVKEVALEVAVNIWRTKDKGLWDNVLGAEGGGAFRFVGGLTNQQRATIEAIKAKYAGPVVI